VNATATTAKEKLQARRRVMKDIRGNRSTMKTLDQVNGLPKNMQMDAVRQVSSKGRKGTKSKATVKPTAESVAQSTADVMSVLRNANSQVLQAAIDQGIADVMRMFPAEQTQGLNIPEVKAAIEVHMKQWIETGKFPDNDALQELVRLEFHKKLNIPAHFDHASDNEIPNEITSTTAQVDPPTGLLPLST